MAVADTCGPPDGLAVGKDHWRSSGLAADVTVSDVDAVLRHHKRRCRTVAGTAVTGTRWPSGVRRVGFACPEGAAQGRQDPVVDPAVVHLPCELLKCLRPVPSCQRLWCRD